MTVSSSKTASSRTIPCIAPHIGPAAMLDGGSDVIVSAGSNTMIGSLSNGLSGVRHRAVLALFAALLVAHGCDANDPAPPRSKPNVPDSIDGYPDGPYGVTNGSVVADISWSGWRNPAAVGYSSDAFETISLSDYYDPDGTAGFNAIFVNASARWCSICKLEQRHLRSQRDIWEPRGVVFIEALFENAGSGPAEAADLAAWGNTYQIDWNLVLDPTNKLGRFFDRAASPMNMIINARTMEVRDIITGMPDESWWPNQLAPLTE